MEAIFDQVPSLSELDIKKIQHESISSDDSSISDDSSVSDDSYSDDSSVDFPTFKYDGEPLLFRVTTPMQYIQKKDGFKMVDTDDLSTLRKFVPEQDIQDIFYIFPSCTFLDRVGFEIKFVFDDPITFQLFSNKFPLQEYIVNGNLDVIAIKFLDYVSPMGRLIDSVDYFEQILDRPGFPGCQYGWKQIEKVMGNVSDNNQD